MTAWSTEAEENYLKLIYELALDETPVRTSQLAEGLDLSMSTVSEMLKRLSQRKLIRRQPYHGVVLTPTGCKRALKIIRRHRLWETFLYRVLGVPWSRIHHHACRLEHGTDDELEEALDQHLGAPTFDPHGDPIPSPGGKITELHRLRLDEVEDGEAAEIHQCTNENPKLLSYLASLGLQPGVEVRVLSHAPFEGPLTVSIGGKEHALGLSVAKTLLVKT